jgi:NAD(P)-dependent dehydrogenase (short-subunit alcohol dehydrogenase family)
LIAVDHGAEGIRVNSLLAGYTVSDGFMSHPDATAELGASLTNSNPMKRLATPEEIADAVIFLCSPLARYITGHGLVVDGGHSSMI